MDRLRFAGLLGFYGGAALIAIALLAGGGAVLASKDSAAVVRVGTKITDILNANQFPMFELRGSKLDICWNSRERPCFGT